MRLTQSDFIRLIYSRLNIGHFLEFRFLSYHFILMSISVPAAPLPSYFQNEAVFRCADFIGPTEYVEAGPCVRAVEIIQYRSTLPDGPESPPTTCIINTPGWAGAVLQTPLSLTKSLTDAFPTDLQNIINPKPLEVGSWNFVTMLTPPVCDVWHVTCDISHLTCKQIY